MRTIQTILCGVYTLVAACFATSVSAQTVDYTHEGTTVKLREIEIEAGAEKPFSVIHISDSHLAYADERDDERKIKLATRRGKLFRTPEATLRAQRQYAIENNLPIVHTGDMIDFVSEANLDKAKDIFGQGRWIVAAGNHEYSLYVGEAREDAAYRAKSYDKVQAVYPNDLTLYSQVINGVNFVTLDNGYYRFSKEQFAKMKQEVRKGLPIILVCHNPLYTPELCSHSLKATKGKAGNVVGAPRTITDTYAQKERPKGEEWRNRNIQQRADRTTLRFCKWLKKQEELKGILCGHCHFYFKSQFSPTATQYTVGAGYKGNGYIVHIK
jgi:predicted MPP superfamily phosphohydrolase